MKAVGWVCPKELGELLEHDCVLCKSPRCHSSGPQDPDGSGQTPLCEILPCWPSSLPSAEGNKCREQLLKRLCSCVCQTPGTVSWLAGGSSHWRCQRPPGKVRVRPAPCSAPLCSARRWCWHQERPAESPRARREQVQERSDPGLALTAGHCPPSAFSICQIDGAAHGLQLCHSQVLHPSRPGSM